MVSSDIEQALQSAAIQTLPIAGHLDSLRASFCHQPQTILEAPPGAGKTTVVPLLLLQCVLEQLANAAVATDADVTHPRIILIQPRRVAAVAAAERLSRLLGETPGQHVGYSVRGESLRSAATMIEVVTDGLMIRRLQSDPELGGAAVVIFDEFHERSLSMDLALSLTLQVQSELCPELHIMLMSATLDTGRLQAMLPDAGVVTSAGRQFPVAIEFLGTGSGARPSGRVSNALQRQSALLATISTQIVDELASHTGGCLVFLPGQGDIARIHAGLREIPGVQTDAAMLKSATDGAGDFLLLDLHGGMKLQAQQQVLKLARQYRCLILCTNIAETSLTIDGISAVIDSGLVRRVCFDPGRGLNRSQVVRIAQDSATQRSGRAGRLAAGRCYRMWTQAEHAQLLEQTPPAIEHSDLTDLCLELALWGVSAVDELSWVDLPPSVPVQQSRRVLCELGLLHTPDTLDAPAAQRWQITALGRQISRLGVSARLAVMLLAAQRSGVTELGCQLAALLSERDLLGRTNGIDIELRLRQLETAATKSRGSVGRVVKLAKQLQRALRAQATIDNDVARALPALPERPDAGALLAIAFPDRIARRRGQSGRYRTSGGSGVTLADDEPMQQHEWLLVLDANLETNTGVPQRPSSRGDAIVRLAAVVTPAALQVVHAAHVTERQEVSWNQQRQRVEAVHRRSLFDLELSSQSLSADEASAEAIAEALLGAVRANGLDCLQWTPAGVALRQRLQCFELHRNRLGDQFVWPACDDAALLEQLELWLLPHISGCRSLAALKKIDLMAALLHRLDWQQRQQLDQCLPVSIQVPSGSTIRIDYSDPQHPVLPVRVQEVFGWQKNPLLMQGTLLLTLQLLSPAQRPVQRTSDLAHFWTHGYADMRKELRGRYQKHYWPEDPQSAVATRITKKAMDRRARE